MSISTELKLLTKILEDSYHNASGLIDFMKIVRTDKNDFSGKYNCRLKVVSGLFSKSVWSHVSGPGGHIVVKHKLTHVVVNFSNHEDPVDAGAMLDIAERVQSHLNILANEIFGFKKGAWKKVPNFEAIAKHIV